VSCAFGSKSAHNGSIGPEHFAKFLLAELIPDNESLNLTYLCGMHEELNQLATLIGTAGEVTDSVIVRALRDCSGLPVIRKLQAQSSNLPANCV
jgi:hypothetical protein